MPPHHPNQEGPPFAQKNQLCGRFQDTLWTDNESLSPQGKDCITHATPEIAPIMMNQKKIIQVMHQEDIGGPYPSHNPCQCFLADEGAVFPAKRRSAQPHHPPTGSRAQAKNLARRCREQKTPKDSQGSETEPLDDPAHSHRSHCILPCSRRLAYHTLALHMCTTASVHVQEGSAATLHLPPETNPTKLLCAEYSPGLRPQTSDAPKGAPSIRTRPQNARHHAACTTYPWLLPTRCDHTKVTLALIRPPYQLTSILT